MKKWNKNYYELSKNIIGSNFNIDEYSISSVKKLVIGLAKAYIELYERSVV